MGKEIGPYIEKAKDILAKNKYMALATSSKDGTPWAAVVFYAYDKNYNFYFLSAIDARHSENIDQNKKMAAVVFDSSSAIGTYDSVQIEGTATKLDGKKLLEAIKLYAERVFPNSKMPPIERYRPENFSGASEFAFFKIEPKAVYATGVTDRRVEVDLNE